MSSDPEPEDDDAWRVAAGRFDYQLHYVRSPDPRRIDHYGGTLIGPPLDHDGRILADPTVEDYVREYLGMAVAELVHEALEWTRVDGRPYLDPHGLAEDRIHRAVEQLVWVLHELHVEDRERHAPAHQSGGTR